MMNCISAPKKPHKMHDSQPRCAAIMPRTGAMFPARVIMLTVCTLLSACAQTVETRVVSAGVAGAAPTRYIAALPNKISSQEYDIAHNLVATKLADRGYVSAADATLFLQVGVAQRPASLSLTQGGTILSPASAKRGSRRCAISEYRLTVALTKIADGAEMYRAAASEYHCKLNIGAVLPRLVDAALADLGKPKGGYVTKRKQAR